jgi:hypothetical protein
LIRGAAALGILVSAAGLLRAQEASLFLGGSHARYADSLAGTAGFAALRLGQDVGGRAVRFDAGYSRFADGGWAVQAGGQTTALWPVESRRRVWAGLAAGGVLSDFQDGPASATVAAGPLAVWRIGTSYFSLGVSGGAVRSIDATWQAVGGGSVRWQWGPDGPLNLDLGVKGTAADSQRFADLSVGFRVTAGGVRGLAMLGVRAGDLADNPWGSVELAWSPMRAVTIEAAAGRYPRDLSGFTEGFYGQGGVRLYLLGTGRAAPARRPAALAIESRRDGSVVVVSIRLPRDVAQAAIAGEWNAWEPVALRRQGDRWLGELRLAPGWYRYAIVADGEWILPEGVAGLDDGFGGTVGVLVVP